MPALTETAAAMLTEVVTHAQVRYVDLPFDAGRFALITLDNGLNGAKPNTFGPGGLTALEAALDKVERDEVVGVGIIGRSRGFAAGADLRVVEAIDNREQGLALGASGHHAFHRFRQLEVPTFAFYNGSALGGGLELGLHCTYRTISATAAVFGLPECSLGLVPGWGGTQLLPNLIGVDAAVTVIVENPLNQNRMLSATQMLDLGIADVMLESADFLDQSLAWAATVIKREVTVDRREVDRRQAAWAAALARGKALADAKVHGAAPAPYRALELIDLARSASRDEGFAAENEALADLTVTDELRAALYSFNLVQKRAKRPAGAPDSSLARPVTKVGIVGAGLMAAQLALLFARQLHVPVVMTDIDQTRLDKGVGYVHREIDKLAAKKRLSNEQAGDLKASVTGSPTKDAFADAGFVIEAVFEDMTVKQRVFAEVEAAVAAECVLATNTSSLSVSEMAVGLSHPERVVGFHFFNPVAVLPLLEVVRGQDTDDATLATAFDLAMKLNKTGVLISDAPAFAANRILVRLLSEVIKSIDEGTPFAVADSAMEPVGLPMSPLALLALVGPGVAHHVTESLHAAFPERFYVSENLGRMVAAGKRGFYITENGRSKIDLEVAALFTIGDNPSTAEQVRERVLAALAQEARLMLDDGVVAEPQDIDLCMLTGAGWPPHLGGITPYLDRSGISERVTGRRFLAPGVASFTTVADVVASQAVRPLRAARGRR
jgi:3-hydroxyacyl-CoA dehydrogenase/enoyl-CoA hydratase/carnithine racemase